MFQFSLMAMGEMKNEKCKMQNAEAERRREVSAAEGISTGFRVTLTLSPTLSLILPLPLPPPLILSLLPLPPPFPLVM